MNDEILFKLLPEICKNDFAKFIRLVNPNYVFNWHHKILIEKLQAVADGKTKILFVTMPPRHGKTETTSLLFPAWLFARNRNQKVISCSYSIDLAARNNRKVQGILLSERYLKLFGKRLIGSADEVGVTTSKRFDISGGGGHLISAGVGGGITGEGCDIGIIDDPVKNAEEAASITYREKTWEWFRGTFYTRLETGGAFIICQTRWHEDDLTGRIIKMCDENGLEYEKVDFPALCETPKAGDPRKLGEALWKEKFSEADLKVIRKVEGERNFSALYQQHPTPMEGDVIKTTWFDYYDFRALDLKKHTVNFFFDTAYTSNEKNDPCAAIAYVYANENFYVISCEAHHLDFNNQIRWVQDFVKTHGYSPRSRVRVEPKATGKSVVDVLKKNTGLNIMEAIAPKESKVARANAVSGVIETGRVLLPKGLVWVESFLVEVSSFPNAPHDDRVDCLLGMIQNEMKAERRIAPRRIAGF